MGRKSQLQWKVFLLALVSSVAFAAPTSTSSVSFDNPKEDPGFITEARQLTFVGPRSGEGYFSADGKKMIFQSERAEGNPFYQIYLMDLETGKTQQVSPGKGKTTCAWIHPTKDRVLFASTHLDPHLSKKVKEERESRKASQKGKYSWSFDENFDLFETDFNGKKIKRLTREKGYDAEGDYSPDGKLIVFSSNRGAYTEKLTPEEQKLVAQDPSYMMDIYLMNSDGTHVRRLTKTRGYDGGPFFSADGKKITWRRFAPNGQSAEIFTMNIDGSEEKQITHLKAMSWAPYFHPSGDYLIFTTNILGFSNFELFIADTKGEKAPIRVSYLDGFDGLPVFTPDGNRLSWTRRNEKGESQIYISQWDDKKARKLLGLPEAPPRVRALASEEINAQDAKTWVDYLASAEMGGRATGSPEEKVYTAQLAKAFQDLGLVPAQGKDFIVPFTFTSGVSLGEKNELKFQGLGKEVQFKISEDFVPLSFSKTGTFKSAPLAFAGYGIAAPATDSLPAYDSYKGLDVSGKWALIFREIPEDISSERRAHLNRYSRLHHKALIAKQAGAVGLLVVNGPNAPSKNLIKLKYEGGFADSGIPILSISDKTAETLIKSTGKSLEQWQDANDKGEVATSLIEKAQLSAQVDLNLQKSQGLNVVAKLRVKNAKSSLAIGAHGDHLGHGEQGNSLARGEEQGHTHFGADDNASGVAALMEIAKSVSAQKKAGKLRLKQNLIFAVWSGEESGLLGSSAYTKNLKNEKITAYLNMDMVGRLKDKLMIQGVASAKEWRSELEPLATQTSLALSSQDDPYVPTDGMQFYLMGIPSITFFTGAHPEYHTPRDTAETLNYPGLVKVAQLVEQTALRLASRAQPLTYQKVESSKKQMEGRSFRIFLGTIPDYTQEGIKGVKISGTSKGSPAEKAGLRAGDVIVELGNTKIENLYDYVYCLQAMKANVETPMKIHRQGSLVELKIIPGLKE